MRITSGLLGGGFTTTSITDDDRDTGYNPGWCQLCHFLPNRKPAGRGHGMPGILAKEKRRPSCEDRRSIPSILRNHLAARPPLSEGPPTCGDSLIPQPPLRSTPAHGIVLAWGPGRRSLVKPRGGFSGFARPAAALVLGDAYVCVSGTVPGTSSSWNPFRGRGGWRPARDSPGLRYTRKASPSCGCPRTQNGRARRPSSHRAVIPRDREAHSPPRIFFPQLACCH